MNFSIKFFSILVLTFNLFYNYSQNLIKNHDFSVYTSHQHNGAILKKVDTVFVSLSTKKNNDSIYVLPDWSIPDFGTPDFYKDSTCFSSGCVGIICNYPDFNNREFIQGTLISTLIEGETYHFTCYLKNSARKYSQTNNIYLDELGLLFTNYKIGFGELNIKNVDPSNCSFIKVEKNNNWQKVEFNYLAKGWEKYVVLGNFHEDTFLSEEIRNSRYKVGYVILDNLELSPTKKSLPIKENQKIIDDIFNINFDFNSYMLDMEAIDFLKKKIDAMAIESNKFISITLKGYTDPIGSIDDNLMLANLRCKSVRDYLIENGINEKNISMEALGECEEMDSDDFEDCRTVKIKIERYEN